MLALIMGIYMYSTDSGRQMFNTIYTVVRSPIDKATEAKDQMNARNEDLKSDLDEIVDIK